MTLRWRRQKTDPYDTPWRTIDYAVIDLETTGLDLRRDTIASYGITVIRQGRMIAAENVYSLVRPESAMSPESIRIHALRPSDLVDAPPLSAAVARLAEALADRVLVAHAAWIEQAFLSRAFRRNRMMFRCAVIDTAAMARAADLAATHTRGEPNLEDLAGQLGLPVVSPHHALGDAITTAEVFLALASRLSQLGHRTARDFIDLTTADSTLRG
jgi:DNA polymerase-3 subunit epsilon